MCIPVTTATCQDTQYHTRFQIATAGLDPVERVRFRNLIASLGREGIVLVSTHIASDIEQIADTLLIMQSGKLVYNQPLEKGKVDLEAFYLSKFGGV